LKGETIFGEVLTRE